MSDTIEKIWKEIHTGTSMDMLKKLLHPRIVGKRLGGGDNGVTYQVGTNKALKIVYLKNNKDAENFKRECQYHSELAQLGIAPKIYEQSAGELYQILSTEYIVDKWNQSGGNKKKQKRSQDRMKKDAHAKIRSSMLENEKLNKQLTQLRAQLHNKKVAKNIKQRKADELQVFKDIYEKAKKDAELREMNNAAIISDEDDSDDEFFSADEDDEEEAKRSEEEVLRKMRKIQLEIERLRPKAERQAREKAEAKKVAKTIKINNSLGIILMDKIYPITTKKVYSDKCSTFPNKLIRIIAKSVYHGYIHNDLHIGNIAKKTSRTNEPILIDFGLTQKIQPPTNPVVFNQIVIAQLYALTDSCNQNNFSVDCEYAPKCDKLSDGIDDIYNQCNSCIMDVIYDLRNGQTDLFSSIVEEVSPLARTISGGGRKRSPMRKRSAKKKRSRKKSRKKSKHK